MNYLEIRWQAGSTYFKVVHQRSEEHTSELQSRLHLVCRLLLEKKKKRPPASTLIPCLRINARRHTATTPTYDPPTSGCWPALPTLFPRCVIQQPHSTLCPLSRP